MDGDGVVEIALRRAHLHGYGKTLKHFVDTCADDVTADHSLLGAYRDEFHLCTWFT